MEFVGSYLDRYRVDNGGVANLQECAGKYGFLCGNPTPTWRHKARLTWDMRGPWTVSFQWRHIGSMSLEPIPDFPPPGPFSAELPAQSFFDLTALFQVEDNYTFRFGVNNLFDREPPLIPFGEGGGTEIFYNGNTYPQWYDPLGRFFFAGVTARF